MQAPHRPASQRQLGGLQQLGFTRGGEDRSVQNPRNSQGVGMVPTRARCTHALTLTSSRWRRIRRLRALRHGCCGCHPEGCVLCGGQCPANQLLVTLGQSFSRMDLCVFLCTMKISGQKSKRIFPGDTKELPERW